MTDQDAYQRFDPIAAIEALGDFIKVMVAHNRESETALADLSAQIQSLKAAAPAGATATAGVGTFITPAIENLAQTYSAAYAKFQKTLAVDDHRQMQVAEAALQAALRQQAAILAQSTGP